MLPKNERYTNSLVVLLLSVAFLVGGMWGGIIGGGLVLWVFNANNPAQPSQIVQVVQPTALLASADQPMPIPSPTPTPVMSIIEEKSEDKSVEDAVAAILPSVVTVINMQEDHTAYAGQANSRIVGSGVIVDPAGYVVTNAHVVEGPENITILLADGHEIPASLLVTNPDLDLALLKVEATLQAATWGDSAQVRLGQSVVAIGSALGDFPNSVTLGVVSGLNRALALDNNVVHGLIQTDAAINQGNSGGPLVNLEGQVVGINTFMIREDHNQGVAQGIGFAIPASSVKALVGAWIAEETNIAQSSLNPNNEVTLEPGAGTSSSPTEAGAGR